MPQDDGAERESVRRRPRCPARRSAGRGLRRLPAAAAPVTRTTTLGLVVCNTGSKCCIVHSTSSGVLDVGFPETVEEQSGLKKTFDEKIYGRQDRIRVCLPRQ